MWQNLYHIFHPPPRDPSTSILLLASSMKLGGRRGKTRSCFQSLFPLSGMWYQKNKTRQPKIHPFFPSPIPFGVVLHYGFSSSIGDRNTIFWRSCVLNHDGFTGRRKTGRKKNVKITIAMSIDMILLIYTNLFKYISVYIHWYTYVLISVYHKDVIRTRTVLGYVKFKYDFALKYF